MKSNKLVLSAIVLGVLAVVLVNAHVSKLQAKVEVPKATFYSAAADVAPGVTLAEAIKRKLLVPVPGIPDAFARGYPQAVDSGEYELWARKRIEHTVPAGEFLHVRHFKRSTVQELRHRIPPGHALTAIPASRNTTVGFLPTPGDRVDVYTTVKRNDPSRKGGLGVEAVLVVEGMRVFAVGGVYGGEGRRRGRSYDSLTLSGPKQDIEKVIAASKVGELTLTLPNQGDAE